jgi:hypothetical protein
VFNSDSISAEPIDFAIKTGDGVEYSGMGILGAGCGIVDQITKKYCKSQTVIEDEEFGIIGYRSHFIGKIRNKGQVALYDPKIQEYNTNLYCEITSVNGLPIVPAVPIPNEANRYVKVPTNAKFDGILDPADPGKKYGETVTFGIDCEHDEPNLVNVLNSKVFTAGGVPIPGSAKSNMARQCPLEEELAIEIDKTCDGVNPGERLMAMDGHLVVEICPRIRVSNKGREMLYDVTVTDDKVDGLKVGLNIGSLAPDETVDLGDDLGVDTCYMPSAPNEPAVGDHGTPNDPSDDKYDPERATFTNTAEVTARGEDGGNTTDMDSATCSLADTGVPDQD